MSYWDKNIFMRDISLTLLTFVCGMMCHMRDMFYSYVPHHSFVYAVGQINVLWAGHR